jgi:hypothetical protein
MPEPATPLPTDPTPNPAPANDPAPTPADPAQQKPTAEQTRDAKRFKELTEQLKSTSSERDQLRDRVTLLHRREVERMAGALAVPSDLWDIGGATVDELLTDGGEVSPAKVEARVKKLIEARPGLAQPPVAPLARPLPGPGAQPPGSPGAAAATFAGVLREKGVRP